MRKENFGLKVIGGQELPSGLVIMEHKQVYSLRLSNFNETLKCDAIIHVDGKDVGRFRIEPFSIINIKRPVKDDGMFTFYRHGTDEANSVGLVGKDSEGEIRVEFLPELNVESPAIQFIESRPLSPFCSGGTGISGVSGQKFINAERIDVDVSKAVTIVARLVCADTPRVL